MTEFERINKPRIDKILGMIRVIEKSAKVHRAEADLVDLYQPIVGAIGLRNSVEKGSTERPRLDIEIQKAAEEAPLHELVRAMATFLNRIDYLLAEMRR